MRYVVVHECYVILTARWRSPSRLQAMLFAQLADDKEEASAKKSLAVLTELYRRNVWTDARTVNVIASACFHTSHGLLIAALKFFLGQDAKSDQVRNLDRFVLQSVDPRAVGVCDVHKYAPCRYPEPSCATPRGRVDVRSELPQYQTSVLFAGGGAGWHR